MPKPFIRKKIRGVAILTVLISITLMMAIVTELSTRETVYYKLALNERDALQAEALAQSGANFAQLLLMVQEPLQNFLTNLGKVGAKLPAYTIWELMPIDSFLLQGITEGSFLPDFSPNKSAQNADNKNKKSENIQETPKVPLVGPYVAPQGGYGGFAGHFSTIIEDEEKKISLRKWTESELSFPRRKLIADMIFRLLNKPENAKLFDGSLGDNKNVTPAQLVGNIYDWMSKDDQAVDVSAPPEQWGRNLVGDKRSIYLNTPGIQPKKAMMDSLAELRLVHGMTDALYKLLAKHLTIYGESDKINILSASDEIMGSVFYMCTKNRESSRFQQPGFLEELLASWIKKKNEADQAISLDALKEHLVQHGVEVDEEECKHIAGTESKTFTVKSTATVGSVTKTLLMRLRSAGGITTIYQYQYL
jgi:hypothetical protein